MCYVRNNLKQHATHFDKNYVVVVFAFLSFTIFRLLPLFSTQIPIWFTFLVQWRYLYLHYFKIYPCFFPSSLVSLDFSFLVGLFFVVSLRQMALPLWSSSSSSSSSQAAAAEAAVGVCCSSLYGSSIYGIHNAKGWEWLRKWCKVAATKPLWTERGKRQQDNKIRKKKQKWKNQNCDFSIILFSSCDRAVTSTCMHLPCECATRPSAAIEVLASPGTRVRQVPCTATDMEQVPHAVRFVDPIHPMGRHLTNDNQVVLPCCIA